MVGSEGAKTYEPGVRVAFPDSTTHQAPGKTDDGKMTADGLNHIKRLPVVYESSNPLFKNHPGIDN